MQLKSMFAALALTFGSLAAAQASTVDFDLRSNGGDVTSNFGISVSAESEGVGLSIHGFAFSGGLGGRGYLGDATAWGNGVGLRALGPERNDAHFVDGWFDEYLLLSFSEEVDITGLSFSYADAGDNWVLYSVQGSGLSYSGTGTLGGNGRGNSVFNAGVMGDASTQYLLGTTRNYSEWKLRGLSVDIAPVPLPAGAWLLLGGLGGLAVMRRRQKASSAT